MDPAIREALDAFVGRRKREIAAAARETLAHPAGAVGVHANRMMPRAVPRLVDEEIA